MVFRDVSPSALNDALDHAESILRSKDETIKYLQRRVEELEREIARLRASSHSSHYNRTNSFPPDSKPPTRSFSK